MDFVFSFFACVWVLIYKKEALTVGWWLVGWGEGIEQSSFIDGMMH